MGFMRKALFLGTGGLSGMAGVRANSKKERTAKATEKQVRLTKQRSSPTTRTSTERRWKVACPECKQEFLSPLSPNIGCPHCRARLTVGREGFRHVYATHATLGESNTQPSSPLVRPDGAIAEILAERRQPGEGSESPAADGQSISAELQHLAELHNSGALSDAEFAAAKAKVLGA
jgi:DNA-directed RNA polymerase subunit RPC12/RpoP